MSRPFLYRFAITFLAVFGGFSVGVATAQTYPSQPIKLIVPWPPGGLTDTIGRLVALSLGEKLGQSVFVENRAGASGNIGTAQFVRSKPDGYTLLLASSTPNSANPHLFAQTGFEPIKDFAPISMIATAPNVLLVPANSSFQNAQQLLAAAKAKPNSITYGSAGSASSGHLAGATMATMTKTELLHVPYKGAGPALIDLMSGQIHIMMDPSALPHIRSGKLRALAVPARQRLPALPDVPTFEEATGIPNVLASAWYGLMAPAGTSREIVERLNREMTKLLQDPEIRQKFINYGADIGSGTPDEFARFVVSELDRYGNIIKTSGAKLE
jgi:tripartite-type tricarboxylate transporter receptor subunit TctC